MAATKTRPSSDEPRTLANLPAVKRSDQNPPHLYCRLGRAGSALENRIVFDGVDITNLCTGLTIVGNAGDLTEVELRLLVTTELDLNTDNILTVLKGLNKRRSERLQSTGAGHRSRSRRDRT